MMSTDYEDGVKAGKLDARQDDHARRLDAIEKALSDQNVKIDKLLESMAVARGGYRALVSVGLISASVAGGVTELIRWISHK